VKSIALAFLLVGTIIGAGFASGREILSFFGTDNGVPLIIAPLTGLFIFLVSVLFLSVGAKVKSDNIGAVNVKVCGKAHIAADMFLLFNGLVSLAAMLAGTHALFSMVRPAWQAQIFFIPIPPVSVYSLAVGIICVLVVVKGLKGLLRGNSVIVPVIIITIVIICAAVIFRAPARPAEGTTLGAVTGYEGVRSGFNLRERLNWINFGMVFGGFNIRSVIMVLAYVSMNMMLAATVFTTINQYSKKQIIAASAIAAVAISLLMFFIVLALNKYNFDGAMPLLQNAQNISQALFYVAIAAVAVSVFTTMMTAMAGLNAWLKPLVGGRGRFSIALILLAGLIVAQIGFENVVGVLYPIIGALGAVYITACIIFTVRQSKKQNRLILQNNPPLDKI